MGIFGQINMSTNGYVTIGSTATATQPLDVRGPMQVIVGSYSGQDVGIATQQYIGCVNIQPLQSQGGYLGYYNRWSIMWLNTLYYYGATIKLSDLRYKENLATIKDPLQKVLGLNAYKYDLKPELFSDAGKRTNSIDLKGHFGLIAQEVEYILPEIVKFDSVQKKYGIMYDEIIPILIEAIKEQQEQIEALKETVKSNDALLKSGSITTASESALAISPVAALEQNSPNPFNTTTEISYTLPPNCSEGSICIYNLNGTQLKAYNITSPGSGKVSINGNELSPGIYLYSLLANGKLISTRQMILTE
jgi:hypothetical protein